MEIVRKIPYVRLRTTKRVFDKKHYTRKVSSNIRHYGTAARKSSLEKIRSALTIANEVLKTDLLSLTKFTSNTTNQIFSKNTTEDKTVSDQVRKSTAGSGFFQPHQALVVHLPLNSKIEKSIEKSSLMRKLPLSAALISANDIHNIHNLPIASLALLMQIPDVQFVLKNYVKTKAYKLNSTTWKNVAVRDIFSSITNRMSVMKVRDTNNTNNLKNIPDNIRPFNFNIESNVELRERCFNNMKRVLAGKLSSATLQKCCLHPNASQRMYSTTSKNSCNGNKSNSPKKNRKKMGTNKGISRKHHSNMKHHKAFLKEKKKGDKRDSIKSYCGGEYSGAENNSKIDFCSGFKQISAGKNQYDKNKDDPRVVRKDSKMDCSNSDEKKAHKCDKNHSKDYLKAGKKSARRKDSKIDCSEFDKDKGLSRKKYCEEHFKDHHHAGRKSSGRKGSGRKDSKIDCSEFHKNKGRAHNKHDKKHSKDYLDAGRKDSKADCSEFLKDEGRAHKKYGKQHLKDHRDSGKKDSKIDCSEFHKNERKSPKKRDKMHSNDGCHTERKNSKVDCSEFLKDEGRAHKKKYGTQHLKDHHDAGRKGVGRKDSKIDCSEFVQDEGQARKKHDKKHSKNYLDAGKKDSKISDFHRGKSGGGKNDRLTQTIQITLPKEVKIEIKTSQVDKDNLK